MSNRPQAAPEGRQTKSALEQPTMTHRGVGTGHRSRLPAPLIYAVAAWEHVAQPSHSPPTAAAAGLVAAPPLRLQRAAIQSYKTPLIFCMASMSYKIWVLYGWFCPRCPCRCLCCCWGRRVAPAPLAAPHSPARPSPLRGGWRSGARVAPRWVAAGSIPPAAAGGSALGHSAASGAQPSHSGARFARAMRLFREK